MKYLKLYEAFDEVDNIFNIARDEGLVVLLLPQMRRSEEARNRHWHPRYYIYRFEQVDGDPNRDTPIMSCTDFDNIVQDIYRRLDGEGFLNTSVNSFNCYYDSNKTDYVDIKDYKVIEDVYGNNSTFTSNLVFGVFDLTSEQKKKCPIFI